MSWVKPYYIDINSSTGALSDGVVYKFGTKWEIVLNGAWQMIRSGSALAETLDNAMSSSNPQKALSSIEIFANDILNDKPFISFRKIEEVKNDYSAIPSYGIF